MASTTRIGSSFSASAAIPTLKSLQQPIRLCWTPDHHVFKIGAISKTLQIPSYISYSNGIESISLNNQASRWRALRVAATVEEAVEATVEAGEPEAETDIVVEEAVDVEKEEEEMTGGKKGEVKDEQMEVNTKLYFGNLPYHCDSAQLAGIVQQYGTPELVELLYNRETGKSRGFAFVTMSNIEDCNAVIENLDGRDYGGRLLKVNFSDKPRPREPLYPETEHKLFVGNLSWSATSENLYQIFEDFGNIVGARILYDGDTGRSRGYGFVSYASREEMETALTALNGVELEGRPMRVSVARGKKS